MWLWQLTKNTSPDTKEIHVALACLLLSALAVISGPLIPVHVVDCAACCIMLRKGRFRFVLRKGSLWLWYKLINRSEKPNNTKPFSYDVMWQFNAFPYASQTTCIANYGANYAPSFLTLDYQVVWFWVFKKTAADSPIFYVCFLLCVLTRCAGGPICSVCRSGLTCLENDTFFYVLRQDTAGDNWSK